MVTVRVTARMSTALESGYGLGDGNSCGISVLRVMVKVRVRGLASLRL